MKKFTIAALTLIMTILMFPVVPMSASAKENLAAGWSGDAEDSRFYDDADLFTDSEEEKITKSIQDAAEELKMNIIVYTAGSDHIDKTDVDIKLFCDANYDNTFGAYTDGVFYFMDFSGRKPASDCISTSGKAELFYEEHINSIFSAVNPYLPPSGSDYTEYTDDIKSAIDVFLGQLSAYEDKSAYRYNEHSGKYLYYDGDEFVITDAKPLRQRLKMIFIAVPVGIIAALIYFFAMKHAYKFKSSMNPSAYVSSEDTRFLHREDRFIRTYTTKRKIESSSGGGRSGGGGGGGSHGGGISHR